MAMHMFMSPVAYRTVSVVALMMATSRSGKSHPTGRPDCAALAPLTRFVQLPPLSSIQLAPIFFTISPTAGGAGLPGFLGGRKFAPLLGGGLTPPYGPAGLLTTFGGTAGTNVCPPPRIVERFPDSKTAT